MLLRRECVRFSGAKRDAISELIEYLVSRGYLISVDGKHLSSDFSSSDLDAAVKTLFPTDDKVVWASVLQVRYH